eukprot:3239236-Ditylum_brightwellii.AAC.1
MDEVKEEDKIDNADKDDNNNPDKKISPSLSLEEPSPLPVPAEQPPCPSYVPLPIVNALFTEVLSRLDKEKVNRGAKEGENKEESLAIEKSTTTATFAVGADAAAGFGNSTTAGHEDHRTTEQGEVIVRESLTNTEPTNNDVKGESLDDKTQSSLQEIKNRVESISAALLSTDFGIFRRYKIETDLVLAETN